MDRDCAGAGSFSRQGSFQRIGISREARLPEGCDVIDVNAKFDHGLDSGIRLSRWSVTLKTIVDCRIETKPDDPHLTSPWSGGGISSDTDLNVTGHWSRGVSAKQSLACSTDGLNR